MNNKKTQLLIERMFLFKLHKTYPLHNIEVILFFLHNLGKSKSPITDPKFNSTRIVGAPLLSNTGPEEWFGVRVEAAKSGPWRAQLRTEACWDLSPLSKNPCSARSTAKNEGCAGTKAPLKIWKSVC